MTLSNNTKIRTQMATDPQIDGDSSRLIAPVAWHIMMIMSIGTFMGFMLFDPEPSMLLSSSVAMNMAIMIWASYRLYQWDLLLSPMGILFVGPFMILYYTWGNLGARIAGEGRYGSNPGSLAYYPQAAFLSTLGLLIFCGVVFGLFSNQIRNTKIRYQDLQWQPWQVISANLIAIGILFYLSLKYNFVGGYFRGVDSTFDGWLAASQYFCVMLAAVTSVSVMLKATSNQDKLVGMLGIAIPVIIALGLRSRTFMLFLILTITLCWLTLRPNQIKQVLIQGILLTVILFGLGTVVKVASVGGETSSLTDNLEVVNQAGLSQVIDDNQRSAELDYQYRLAGLEYPAALIRCIDQNVSPMYGNGLIGGILQNVPGFLRPAGTFSERWAISQHYKEAYCIRYGDSIGIPLTSGVADWGIFLSPLIYIIPALYSVLLWKAVQNSPRLFVAYLVTGASLNLDLVWDGELYIIRTIGFTWLILLTLSPFLMPRWQEITN